MASSPRIDELRKKFEENPRRYFAPLANEYRKAGEIEQAIAICREYLPQQPGHMSGHIVFGQALFEAKQLDEAKTVFETALSLDPENLIALKHLGDITLAAGDKEGAKGWYKRVLDADPRNEEAQAQMALLEPKAATTPVVAQAVTETSKTQAMPAAKPGPGSSAPTVVMQAMRPLPKLGATGLPIPAVPNPAAAKSTPTPVPSLSSQPTTPIQIPVAAPPAAPPAATPAAPPKAPALPAAPPPAALAPTQEIRLEGFSTGADSAAKVVAGSSSVPATVIMEALPGVKPVSAADVPVAPTIGLETTSVAASEPPPIGGFSLEGLETTSMAPPLPAPTPVAAAPEIELALPSAPPAAAAPAPPADAPLPMIDLDMPAAAPAPAATAPAPSAPAEAPLPMIDLDMPAATPAPAPPAPPAPTAAATPAGDAGLVDLTIDLPTPAAPPPPAPPPAPPEAMAPPPPAAPVAPVELEIEAPAPTPDSGPFVTETMAELYLQQGHRDEALRVYRALLEQRPGDAGLLSKIAELSGVAAPSVPAAEPEPEMPPLPPADGPTIRAVLMLIAMRRPGYRPDAPEGNGAAVHAGSAEPTTDAQTAHGADSLSHLWNNAPPNADEENAALMLLAAFHDLSGASHGNGTMDLSGAAAEAAATQAATAAALASGAPAAPSSFSFDKFFSQRATAEHAAQASKAGPGGAPAESKEDAAKFSQWLEGLKQR